MVPSGHVTRNEWVLEGAVLETQHQASVVGGLGFNSPYAWNPPTHCLQHLVEKFRMALVEVLCHQGDVITSGGEVLGISVINARAGVCYVEVRDIPVFYQAAKLGNYSEFL